MNAMNNLELKKIKENPLYIREIENPSEEMQLEAIKKNPFTTIKSPKNPFFKYRFI